MAIGERKCYVLPLPVTSKGKAGYPPNSKILQALKAVKPEALCKIVVAKTCGVETKLEMAITLKDPLLGTFSEPLAAHIAGLQGSNSPTSYRVLLAYDLLVDY